MSAQKCVVEGCNLEYDVVCSFSFYNVNTSSEGDPERQEWISGAMREEGECLWRHVSLHLCGYHFELDSQGLWIDSPMLPELLTPQPPADPRIPTEEEKAAAELVKVDHNYSADPQTQENEPISRLNVRQLVDTLGYLSMKNLQRKQLWVVKVETDKAEASITQSEQVITKMQEAKVIEIIPQAAVNASDSLSAAQNVTESEEIQSMDDPNNFIYEIAEEQEISMDEVKEIPVSTNQEWMVNIIPDESKSKYAFIKHCHSGKKKRHFTADMSEVTLQGDFDNYYILPDADPSLGVEITTSYEPENYVVEGYPHLVLDERPKKRIKKEPEGGKRKKKMASVREQVKQIKSEMEEDWAIEGNISFDQDDSDDFDPKKGRARRKNKKYDYDFVT